MRTVIAFLVSMALAPVLAQSSNSYRVTHTYVLGGEGGWDYIVPDPQTHRLFIARQNRVMVVSEDSGAVLGEVAAVDGAHGTAVVADTGRGFATSANDQSVVMFDLQTLKVLGRIPAAEDADAIIYDDASRRVFTFNGDAHSSTVIDPRTGKAITNIALGGKPEYGASGGDGKVYANLTDTSEIVEIDARGATVLRRWPTAPCKQPVAMAIDTAHHRLFSGCRSGVLAVSDYVAGKVVATVPIGSGVDGAGFDREHVERVCIECGWDADRHPPGRARSVPRRRERANAAGVTQHGTRCHDAPAVRRVSPVRTGAAGRRRGPVLPDSFAVLVIEPAQP